MQEREKEGTDRFFFLTFHALPEGLRGWGFYTQKLLHFLFKIIFPKITDWKFSYDGRNKEPVSLPVKFPLLLAQGAMGIAVGLKSEILPHNFNELIDASIAYLKDEPFELYPDFQTGGLVDVRYYNDGAKGCKIKVRARISQIDKKTLVITEIPYAGMFQKTVDNTGNTNIATKRLSGNQTAYSSYNQIYFYPSFACFVQFVYHGEVL